MLGSIQNEFSLERTWEWESVISQWPQLKEARRSFWEAKTSSSDCVRKSKPLFGWERLGLWGKAEESVMEGDKLVDRDILRKQQQQIEDGEKDFRIWQQLVQNSLFHSFTYCKGTVPWYLPAQWSARWLCKEATFFHGLDRFFGQPDTGQLKDDFDCWPILNKQLYFTRLTLKFYTQWSSNKITNMHKIANFKD